MAVTYVYEWWTIARHDIDILPNRAPFETISRHNHMYIALAVV